MAGAHFIDEPCEGVVLIILPCVTPRGFEVRNDDGTGVGIMVEWPYLPVLRFGRIHREAVFGPVKCDPLVVGEQMASVFASPLRAVVGHGDRRDMRKSEVVHRASAFAILLASLRCPLPKGVFAARQGPARGKPIPFIEVVSDSVRWRMKPFRQTDTLFAAQLEEVPT